MKRALILVLLAGCAGGQLDPRTQRALDTFECRVRALEPYIGDVLDVADLVRDAAQGKANVTQALATLGHTQEAVQQATEAWHACDPKPEAPATVTSKLATREPPY